MTGLRVGIDVGGTFTDVVGFRGHRMLQAKHPSTPHDPALAVLHGLADVMAQAGAGPEDLEFLAHGTTVATNAALERKGARVGLLTTAGFEDVVEIGRLQRTAIYDLDARAETPTFVAPRRRRLGIPERIGSDGGIVIPLDEPRVIAAIDWLVEEEAIEAVAVGYLFSFLDPKHERRTRALIAARYPGLPVSLSSDVDPRFREYERFATTLFDAYLKPRVEDYLRHLEASVAGQLHVMRSSGGLGSVREVVANPVALLQSGLAAGVLGARAAAIEAGYPNAITVDVGGTSCDVALIKGGEPGRRNEMRLGTVPIRSPAIDVHTIGAGGGSIARLDGAGLLHVGPDSAGAVPGPACYGTGGNQPTVTDASLVLGYIGPDGFAGRRMRLDPAAARAAIAPLAEGLGLSIEEAAAGIHRVVNAAMTDAIRRISLHRGDDPRSFALLLLGGGGPLHGAELALDLGINDLVVPRVPGLLAAYGLLTAPVTREWSIPFRGLASDGLRHELQAACAPAHAQGSDVTAHMCYAGQSHELDVPVLDIQLDDAMATLRARFELLHVRLYGRANPGRAIEITGLVAVGSCPPPPLPLPPPSGPSSLAGAHRGSRPVYDWRARRWIETPVYDRDSLPCGAALHGPAIIEQMDTTTVLPTGSIGRHAAGGALLIRTASFT